MPRKIFMLFLLLISVLVVFFAFFLINTGRIKIPKSGVQSDQITTLPKPVINKIIVAAGDITCNFEAKSSKECQQMGTSKLISDIKPDAVLPLGDLLYDSGDLGDFNKYYTPSWGQFKSITRPTPGNHEYGTYNANGYFDYFNGIEINDGIAGPRSKGYYSFDLGSWHLISLNSNCSKNFPCVEDSAQVVWLKNDLANHANYCTLAFWHHPLFSSGLHGNISDSKVFWKELFDAGVDVVLNANDHDYERFAPQDPDGNNAKDKGIREFVVGTGGRSHYDFYKIQPNSEFRNNSDFGVLKLILGDKNYSWNFISTDGEKILDSGTDICH